MAKREMWVVEDAEARMPVAAAPREAEASAVARAGHGRVVTRYVPEDAGTRVWVIEQAGVGVWFPAFVHDSEAAATKDLALFTHSAARMRTGRLVLDPVESPIPVSVPLPKRVWKDRVKAAKVRRGGV